MINFNDEVIDASFKKPVIVDFWASWCAPCRVLGPVIEKIAEEQQDTWTLVKVDTEANQEISTQYGIRSIPSVKMFYEGKIVAEFSGALPRQQILSWLEENLPSEEKNNWSEVETTLLEMEPEEAIDLLTSFHKRFPDHRPSRLALATKCVFSDPGLSSALIADIKIGQEGYDLAQDIHAYTELISLEDDAVEPISNLLVGAESDFRKKDFDAGMTKLIEAVTIDKNMYKELPRRASIAMFHLLGAEHPVTKKYRRSFDMALY